MARPADENNIVDEVAFGPFRLSLTRRLLTRDGKTVKISGRSLDILCELASIPGEVVDKDRLMERVWAGRVVEENAIHVHVSALRKTLEAEGEGQRYVLTVPGRGYRLVGLQSAPVEAERVESKKIPGTSVAVLRFANLSGDPAQDYFAEGISEDIITGLARISGVFVIAGSSSRMFSGEHQDLRTIGRELGVRYLVQGSVRKADNRIRITSRLVEAETGVSLW